MTRSVWDAAIEEYYAEHDSVGTAGDARGPKLLQIDPTRRPPSGSGRSARPSTTPRGTTTG